MTKAWKENFKKNELIATAHIHGAHEKGTDLEEESEDEKEITEDEPSDPGPVWEGLDMGINTYIKIIETPYDLRVLHAESPMSDIYLARGEILI